MNDEVLTEDEVAELVKTRRRVIAEARLDGRPLFPFCLVAGSPRYLRSEVLRTLAAGTPMQQTTQPTAQKRGRGRPRVGC